MKTLSYATLAVTLATLALTQAGRAEDTAGHPVPFVDGVHSPVTHLLEVVNAPVLQASATNTVNGTLAERPALPRPVHTAQNAK